MQLSFVSAEGGSAFMEELLAVVADAVAEIGVATSTHVGAFPPAEHDTVYVVVPHEYFVVTPAQLHPTPEQRQRTIAFCVEHPGNDTFEVTVRHAAQVGAVVDINEDSTAELRRRGLDALPFRLGYSRRWDAWRQADEPRPVDVTYLGTVDGRRSRILSGFAPDLWSREVALLIPPHEPMTKPRADFLLGEAKHRHLARSRVLLNLHRGESRALEWVRVLEAMCNGCVVVSEHSVDLAPLVPGTHLLVGGPSSLGLLTAGLLDDESRLERIRQDAYSFCRTELSMKSSAEVLAAAAERLLAQHPGTPPSVDAAGAASPVRFTGPWSAIGFPAEVSDDAGHRAAFDAAAAALTARGDGSVRHFRKSPDSPPRVTAVVAAVGPERAQTPIVSLAAQTLSVEILASEGSPWSRGGARNRLLASAASEFVLVADPVHELLPTAVEKLVACLDARAGAAAAIAIVATEPAGLANVHPFEPERLARTPYLEGPVLIRRAVLEELGRYADSPALAGLEDHDLLCRLADTGHDVALVQQMLVVREPAVALAPRPLDVAPDLSWNILRGRSSRLFTAAGLAAVPGVGT